MANANLNFALVVRETLAAAAGMVHRQSSAQAATQLSAEIANEWTFANIAFKAPAGTATTPASGRVSESGGTPSSAVGWAPVSKEN